MAWPGRKTFVVPSVRLSSLFWFHSGVDAAEILQVTSSSVLLIGDHNRTYTVKLACTEITPDLEEKSLKWLKKQLPRHTKVNLKPKGSSQIYKTIVDLVGIVFFLFPLLYIIWIFSYPFVYKSWQMNEVSREAGGLTMIYLLKLAILIFAFLLFIQVVSKIINNFLNLNSNEF